MALGRTALVDRISELDKENLRFRLDAIYLRPTREEWEAYDKRIELKAHLSRQLAALDGAPD